MSRHFRKTDTKMYSQAYKIQLKEQRVERLVQKYRKYSFICIKASLYCVIITLFVVFYLDGLLKAYLAKNTTFSSKYEKLNFMELPTIVFCIQEGYKLSVMQKYTLKTIYEIPQLQNVNFGQVYDELSYQPNVDYKVEVESSEVNFKRDDIYTFSHGKCQKFQPTTEIKAQMKVILINAEYIGSKSDAPSSK